MLSIVNGEGAMIESVTNGDIHRAQKELGFEGNAWRLMQELYHGARRSAMGADEAIDNILSALGDLPPPF
jgi:hypothetical protein